MELHALQQHYAAVRGFNAELVAISPQVRAKNEEVKQKQRLEFPILADPGNDYAGELSIVHALPEELRTVYTGFGIVLPEFNGDESWELPLPTRIVVDSSGVIRSLTADPDYTHRPEPEETVEVLRTL